MSNPRFYLLTVVVAITLAAAQTPKSQGCGSAPSGVTYGLFANTSVSACAQQTACGAAYTACLGTGKALNCSLANECIQLRYLCLEAAAANTTGCPALNNLYLSIVQVTAGQLWNASNAYKSCVASACRALNESFSGLGSNCTIDNDVLCKSPIAFIASVLLHGNFSGLLNDPVKRKAFADAIGSDVSKALKILGCFVRRMFIAGSKRQADQTLVVELEVPGVSNKNAGLQTAFAALAANPGSFLTETSAAYTAATGQTLTILLVTGGSGSQALSACPTCVPTTAAPVAPTTATPFTNPTPVPTNGGAARSMLAILAVIVVVAAL